MVAIENVIAAGIAVLALVLTGIGALAYRRNRDWPLLVLTAAFALWFVKGVALTAFLFLGGADVTDLFLVGGGLDLVTLAMFYVFTLRR